MKIVYRLLTVSEVWHLFVYGFEVGLDTWPTMGQMNMLD